MEFLNSSLVCPLPSGALFALTDFLNIQDAPTIEISSTDSESLEEENDSAKHVSEECNLSLTTDFPTNCEDMSNQILALSSICTSELLQAERNGNLATELANAMSRTNTNNNISPALYEPLLPTHVTEHLQEAMHSALMKVMAERDEAHAQLVSASVLHAHALEQQKKKAERLEGQLEVAQRKALKLASASQVFGIDRLRRTEHEKQEEEKLRKTEMEMQRNTDAEMVALCQQLSSEISSKTKAALEVVRLKESRAIERQHEIEEKEALKNELIRMRELLAKEQSKTEEALREAEKWKQSYEKVAEEQKRRNGSEADEYNT